MVIARSAGKNIKDLPTSPTSPRKRVAQVKVDTSAARAKIGVGEQAIEVGEKFEVSRLRREKKLFDAQIRIAERQDTLDQLTLIGDYNVGAKNLVAQLDQSTPPGKPINLDLLKQKLDELDNKYINLHTTGTEESHLTFQQKIQEQRNIVEVDIASDNITAQEVQAFDQLQRTINNSKALTLSHGAGHGIRHFNQAFDNDLAPLFSRKTEPAHQLNGQRQLIQADLGNKYKNDEVFGIEEMLADPFFSDILGPDQVKMEYEKLDRFNNKRLNSQAQKTSNKLTEMAIVLQLFDDEGNPDISQLTQKQRIVAIGKDPKDLIAGKTSKAMFVDGLEALGIVKPRAEQGKEAGEGESPVDSESRELTRPENGDEIEPSDDGEIDIAALMKEDNRVTIPLALLLMGFNPSQLPEGPLEDFNKNLTKLNAYEKMFGPQDTLVKKTVMGLPWTAEEKGIEEGIQEKVKEDVVLTNRLINLANANVYLSRDESARLWGVTPDELKRVIDSKGGELWVSSSDAKDKVAKLGPLEAQQLKREALRQDVFGKDSKPEDKDFTQTELKEYHGFRTPRPFESSREKFLSKRQETRMAGIDAGAKSGRASLQSLKVMKAALQKGIQGGPLSGFRQTVAQMASLLGTGDLSVYKIPDAATTEAFESAGAQLKLDLITAMEGIRATNAALRVVTDKVGALSKSDKGNEIIVDIGIAIADRQIEHQRIAAGMLYRPGGLDGNQEDGGDKRNLEDRIDQLEKDDPVLDDELIKKIKAGTGGDDSFARMISKQRARITQRQLPPWQRKPPEGYEVPEGHTFFAVGSKGKQKGVPIIIEDSTGDRLLDRKWKSRVKKKSKVKTP